MMIYPWDKFIQAGRSTCTFFLKKDSGKWLLSYVVGFGHYHYKHCETEEEAFALLTNPNSEDSNWKKLLERISSSLVKNKSFEEEAKQLSKQANDSSMWAGSSEY